MHPDEICFNPQRPSWLPYWLDDLTESGCKVNVLVFGNKTGHTSQPGIFKTVTNSDGSVTVVPAADPAAIENARAACFAQGGRWDENLEACAPDSIARYLGYLPWVVGGLVGIMLLPRVLGR